MSGTDYTANLTLGYPPGNLPRQVIQLTQTVQGSLPSQFQMDSYGRIAIPQAGGTITVTADVMLNKTTTAGATGNLLLNGGLSSAPPLGAPDITRAMNSGGNADAHVVWEGLNLLNRSLEVDLEFTGSGNVQIQSGTLVCVLHVEEQHICSDYDLLTGFKIHKQFMPIRPATQQVGPVQGWCQWCHEVAVYLDPGQWRIR